MSSSQLSSPPSSTQRTYDLILWGATGFTGRLVADYLFKVWQNKKSFRWAIAARNIDKLQCIQQTWQQIDPQAIEIPLLQAQLDHASSLVTLTQQCKVLCTTVGPYALYGTPIIQACIQTHTHYCDLTGETQWIRQIIDQYHEQAQTHQIRLVHACGYDSIPSDLGTYMIQKAMYQHYECYASHVQLITGATRGQMSGGTIASMIQVVDSAQDRKVARILVHPYALSPDPNTHGPDRRDSMRVKYNQAFKSWTSFFIMSSINTRIVRRSHALQQLCYGHEFSYQEGMGWGKGYKAMIRAYIFTLMLGLFMWLISHKWSRVLLQKYILPKPGQGPSEKQINRGYFTMHLHAQHADKQLTAHVAHTLDPGYGSTALMLAESALCLALDEAKLAKRYGCLTPASAMGDVLIERLRQAGMQWDVNTIKK